MGGRGEGGDSDDGEGGGKVEPAEWAADKEGFSSTIGGKRRLAGVNKAAVTQCVRTCVCVCVRAWPPSCRGLQGAALLLLLLLLLRWTCMHRDDAGRWGANSGRCMQVVLQFTQRL